MLTWMEVGSLLHHSWSCPETFQLCHQCQWLHAGVVRVLKEAFILFYPKFLESFKQRSFTAEHLRKATGKGKFCFFSKRDWLSHNHGSSASVFAPHYIREFWPSFEVNQPVPQRFRHNLSAEFWYQKWVGRNTVAFHWCRRAVVSATAQSSYSSVQPNALQAHWPGAQGSI